MNPRDLPQPQACHQCTHLYVGAVCPVCKTERPAYTALKNMTAYRRETALLPDKAKS